MAHPNGKPQLSSAPISMVLPVRNQASLIERAVAAWAKTLRSLERPFQILIVDDGSSDDSATRAIALAEKQSEVEVLRHEQPRGFGAALRTALPHVRHPLLFVTALDYPYTTSDFPKLLERIDRCDLVSGFRAAVRPPRWYAVYRTIVDTLFRIFMGLAREALPGWLGWKVHLYNRLMRTVFGVQLDDVESAYKLIRREVFDCFPIQSEGIFALTEMVAKANFMTLWLDEVPIGAQQGVPAEALAISWNWRERRRDLLLVLRQPEFYPPSEYRVGAPPQRDAGLESETTAAQPSDMPHLEVPTEKP
jgi:hypothetical protein